MVACKNIEADIGQLFVKATIFSHPIALVFLIGEELVVNGVNIFKDIYAAVDFYHKGDYFNFGKNVGGAMDLIFLKNSATKKSKDVKAYDFLDGFCTQFESIFSLD